jgi:predicted nucleic acid-binding protein
MNLYVIDAGIAVKWFLTEPHSDKARRSVYDCLYLALTLERGCELVTSDERFFNAIGSKFPQIKLLHQLTL